VLCGCAVAAVERLRTKATDINTRAQQSEHASINVFIGQLGASAKGA
jgi:hypothetical protein